MYFVQQTDATYMRNLDGLVPSLCALAREHGEDKRRLPIRAAALQALAAMVLANFLYFVSLSFMSIFLKSTLVNRRSCRT